METGESLKGRQKNIFHFSFAICHFPIFFVIPVIRRGKGFRLIGNEQMKNDKWKMENVFWNNLREQLSNPVASSTRTAPPNRRS